MTDRIEAAAWQRMVLDSENLDDWTVQTGEAYCWLHSRTIAFPPNGSRALFLHEVAHALAPIPEDYGNGHSNNYHGGRWAEAYGELVEKYMVDKATDAALHEVVDAAIDWVENIGVKLLPNISSISFAPEKLSRLISAVGVLTHRRDR